MQDNWSAEELSSSRKEHCLESISIVIPALPSTLESTRSSRPLEVVLVDGGSVDGTQGVASRYGVKILFSPPNRASQMNCGAAATSGSVLLFLHADTRLPRHFDSCVRKALSSPTVVAGAFELGIDPPNPSLRWIERMANWRSRRLHMPYGDQAIFVRAESVSGHWRILRTTYYGRLRIDAAAPQARAHRDYSPAGALFCSPVAKDWNSKSNLNESNCDFLLLLGHFTGNNRALVSWTK